MESRGNSVGHKGRSEDHELDQIAAEIDKLAIAGNGKGGRLVELADETGSRIVRVKDGAVVATDAESPALSPEGIGFAYIREMKGRGTLFIFDKQRGAHSVTDSSYDVRQVAFLDEGMLVFAARHQKRLSLFVITKDGSISPFLDIQANVGAFSVSPDGSRIAFTESVKHRWQLGVFDRVNHSVIQITDFDCNAYESSWTSASEIVVASDCTRGLGLTALVKIELPKHRINGIENSNALLAMRPN